MYIVHTRHTITHFVYFYTTERKKKNSLIKISQYENGQKMVQRQQTFVNC